MDMWRFLVFTVFYFSLTSGINNEQAFELYKMVLPSDDSKMEYRLFNLTAGDIETAEIASLVSSRYVLTQNEVNTLVTLLTKVHKDDITPHNGPLPKGGPTRITLFLKTNEKITLILNGRHFLFGGNQVYLPEIRKFAKQVITKHLQS